MYVITSLFLPVYILNSLGENIQFKNALTDILKIIILG